jgi:UDP-glucuronate 4-epimerase
MKFLITGGAGMIGFHTAIKLKEMGHDVRCVDNFNDIIYDSKIKYDRAKILKNKSIKVIHQDIADISVDPDDFVIHLAAHPGVRVSMELEQDYIINNILGTQKVIAACEKAGVENVIYASTSCTMHGNPLPWGPDEKLGKQLSPYGYTKATNEHQFNISKIPNAVCLRFFTVYGPWGRPDMALFEFTKNILEQKPVKLFNNGKMVRDFTYVDDIVQGIEIVTRNMSERETYCIGNGKQVQLMDFLDEIEYNLNKVALKQYHPQHPADTRETWSDTTKLKKLGYSPKISIHEGITRFIMWYKMYYNVF